MKISVVYYSMYGNTFKLAQAVAEGAREIEGAEVSVKQVAELMSKEIYEKIPQAMKAKKMQKDIPIATMEDLIEADAVLFGSPTRFGNMCAQLRQYLDMTGPLWVKGQLVGKPAGVFCSTSTVHGGQETTLISMMFGLLHHGMIIVGIPYSEKGLFATGGGSPYGASSISGPRAETSPTEDDLKLAKALGRRVAEITKKLKK